MNKWIHTLEYVTRWILSRKGNSQYSALLPGVEISEGLMSTTD